ncbi:hypothetical protein QZH41_016981 [Actinostola sp. cb2023]|nr:hypothetical protein QZH41_016981 [Actinostola sp. cb2023]
MSCRTSPVTRIPEYPSGSAVSACLVALPPSPVYLSIPLGVPYLHVLFVALPPSPVYLSTPLGVSYLSCRTSPVTRIPEYNKMKAEVSQAYDNVGSDVVSIQPQSPGTPNSFPTNMQICEPNDTTVTSPRSIPTIGRNKADFLPDEEHEIKMVTWHSRKMRQMSVFLVFFVIIALVMTGLFIWRTVFFDQLRANNHCKTCSTSASTKPTQLPCRLHVRPKPFQTLPKQIVDQLEKIKGILDNNTVSSIANVVYMDKEIWSNFHGKVDPEATNPQKPDGHSLFPVASVTKVFTAVMTFKMYKDRKVDTLDDKFIDYEPNFRIKSRFKTRKIVIRELLSHMSGLPREAPCYPDKQTNMCPFNNSMMLERISDMYLILKPGLKPSYSNLGFGLLGRGLVSLYNTTYEEWMKEYLFNPLGLNDSTFELPPRYQNNKSLEIHLFKSLDEEDYLSPVYVNELFAPAFNVMNTGNVYLDLPTLFRGMVRAFHEVLNKNVTKIALPPNPHAFIGVYETRFENTSLPGLSIIEVEQTNEEMKMIITIYNYRYGFRLNFLKNTTFEIWDRDTTSNCLDLFLRGFDMERIYFDPISNGTDLSLGINIYGMHPRGWTYFRRVK